MSDLQVVNRFFKLQERATDLGFDLIATAEVFSISRDGWGSSQSLGSLDIAEGFLDGWVQGQMDPHWQDEKPPPRKPA